MLKQRQTRGWERGGEPRDLCSPVGSVTCWLCDLREVTAFCESPGFLFHFFLISGGNGHPTASRGSFGPQRLQMSRCSECC